MPPASIRLALAADAQRLAELRWEFRSALAAATEPRDHFIARCASWMRERLAASGVWRCWVLDRGDRIVGHLWLQVIDKVPNPVGERETHAYITNVHVVPDERGRGLGGLLLTTAIEWCRGAGVHCVLLWPTRESRSLYARHGFAVRDDVMELAIE